MECVRMMSVKVIPLELNRRVIAFSTFLDFEIFRGRSFHIRHRRSEIERAFYKTFDRNGESARTLILLIP